MNTLTLAMKTAGVKLPSQMQRIWTWLKDHPNKTARDIEVALKFPGTHTLLSQMEKRCMVVGKVEHNARGGRPTKRFFVTGAEYVLLPLPKKVDRSHVRATKAVQDAQNQIARAMVDSAPLTPQPASKPYAGFELDNLTIAEARALYRRLDNMFGGA